MNKPFYIERVVRGELEWLKVDGWNWKEWNGCFCLVEHKQFWVV